MEERHDNILLGLAQSHQNIQELLETFFSFLGRRTDFFHILEYNGDGDDRKLKPNMGFLPGEAENFVSRLFGQEQMKYCMRAQPHLLPLEYRNRLKLDFSRDLGKVEVLQFQPVSPICHLGLSLQAQNVSGKNNSNFYNGRQEGKGKIQSSENSRSNLPCDEFKTGHGMGKKSTRVATTSNAETSIESVNIKNKNNNILKAPQGTDHCFDVKSTGISENKITKVGNESVGNAHKNYSVSHSSTTGESLSESGVLSAGNVGLQKNTATARDTESDRRNLRTDDAGSGDKSNNNVAEVKSEEQISSWNGSVTDTYVWSQSISDLSVQFFLFKYIVSTDVDTKNLIVKLSDSDITIIDLDKVVFKGEWGEPIRSSESFWSTEGKKFVHLSLEKRKEIWWESLFKGGPKIDTKKVESVKKVEDFDGPTQGHIRKIMFNQQQKLKGLKTTEEIEQEKILKQAWNLEGSPFKGQAFQADILKDNIQNF